ncbi:MAG: hypothetical protein R3B54_16985 [Bdellovibrionota bacterium]
MALENRYQNMENQRSAAMGPWTEVLAANLLGLILLNGPMSFQYGAKLSVRLIPSEMLVLGSLIYPWFIFFRPRTALWGGAVTVSVLSFANCLRMANLGMPLLPSDIHFLLQPQLLAAHSPLSVAVFSALPLLRDGLFTSKKPCCRSDHR